LCHDTYNPSLKSTIGLDLFIYSTNLNNTKNNIKPDVQSGVQSISTFKTGQPSKVKLTIWDTAGQERFWASPNVIFKGLHGAIISIDDLESMSKLPFWYKKVKDNCGNIPVVIIQTKTDLGTEVDLSSNLSYETFQVLSEIKVFKTSSMLSLGIQEPITYLCNKMISNLPQESTGKKLINTEVIKKYKWCV
jgi:GTPase SAR1 family protein